MKIEVVVESMPRCGTHYLIRNLMQIFNLGYCTIYEATKREGQIKEKWNGFTVTYDAGATWYIADGGKNVDKAKEHYVCKTHFMNPIFGNEEFKKIYLWGNPLDFVYLTSRLWSDKRGDPNFFLGVGNQAYKMRVEPHLDRLRDWLDRVVELPNTIRYEDFLYREALVIRQLEEIFGVVIPKKKWDAARVIDYRIIYTGWRDKIDSKIVNHVLEKVGHHVYY